MKFETIRGESKEIYITGNGVSVTVNTWSNMEGCSIMVHGAEEKTMPLVMSGAFRWEELDVILVALTAARG